MKAALAAVAVTALAIAAPMGAAQASTNVTVRVDTPEFGIRIGSPVGIYAPVPVYAPPVYAPAPVYTPAPVYAPAPVVVPPRVVYAPPRVVVPAPVIYPVVYPQPYRYVAPHKHKKVKYRQVRGDYGYHERGYGYERGYGR